jgi:ABC-2 type transport system ATP-binding protein
MAERPAAPVAGHGFSFDFLGFNGLHDDGCPLGWPALTAVGGDDTHGPQSKSTPSDMNPEPFPLPRLAVSLRGLTKVYRPQGKDGQAKVALDHVDLDIPRGALFALLGPNGAGKSTLINIMAQLVIKTEGEVRIWGIDLDADPRHAAAAIGVVPQELNIDPFFTPSQLLDLQAGMYGVPKAERRTAELLEALSLSDKAGAYARTLSGGMRRRLMVAKAMVHHPPVLVLDEPTAGVDVELRHNWRRPNMCVS